MRAADWDRKWRDRDPRVDPSRFLVEEVADLAAGRALDLACGAGRHAVWLAERGWKVTAVDFSTVALEQARALAAERGVDVEWVQADVLSFQPEPRAYDLVVFFYLQLPADERRVALGHAASAVAPGGTLLVVAHDLLNLTEGHGGPSTAAVLYTPAEVADDLGGLTVTRAERVVRPVSDDDGEHEAIDTLVRAER